MKNFVLFHLWIILQLAHSALDLEAAQHVFVE